MADKVKKTSKVKKMTKKETLTVKSTDELRNEIAAKHNDSLEARRGHRAGELANPRFITVTRKEIARLKTILRANELKGDK